MNAGIDPQSMLHHSVPHFPTLTAFSAKSHTLKIQTRSRVSFTVQAAANGAGSHVNEYLPGDKRVREVKLTDIRRPLSRTRANDPKKVKALAESISEIGLQAPIDVLEVEGQLYGFSGCHRYEAHQVLGKETILCRIRKGSKTTLKMHMM